MKWGGGGRERFRRSEPKNRKNKKINEPTDEMCFINNTSIAFANHLYGVRWLLILFVQFLCVFFQRQHNIGSLYSLFEISEIWLLSYTFPGAL